MRGEANTAVGKDASGTCARPPPGIAARLDDFWNSKDVAQITKDAVRKDSQTMRS